MTPTASPRHPWKALAAVLAMFVVVQGVHGHVDTHPHLFSHRHVVDAAPDRDCPDIDIDEDETGDGPVIDLVDDDVLA